MQNSIACRDTISFLSLRSQLESLNIVFPSSRLEKDEGLIIGPALSMEALREEPFTWSIYNAKYSEM